MKRSELREMIKNEYSKMESQRPSRLKENESSMRKYFPQASKAILKLLKRHKMDL